MSIKTRAFVFATFFGNCLVVGLLVAALTTEYWIQATPRRHNSPESKGQINFGLFSGSKDLNYGYGLRNHKIDVVAFIRSEPEVMNYWLWLGAALGTGFGLFSSAIGAIASVLKSASASRKHGTMVLLIISNAASAISQIIAFVCWLVQFYEYMTHNILTAENRDELWYSKDYATLGYSFSFLCIGCIIVFINLILLVMAIHVEKKERHRVEPPCDEKTQGAIMLY